MIQAESPLGHHLFQVPIAERIAQIPTKAEDDDLVLKVSPAKQCRPLVLHSFTLPECTQRVCDRSAAKTIRRIWRRHARRVHSHWHPHNLVPDLTHQIAARTLPYPTTDQFV